METSGANRWWENYLVRYLMPSIAGMVMVLWLTNDTPIRGYLLLPPGYSEKLSTSSVVLSFLYGNVFCYVASYPILTFHATRMLDFRDAEGRTRQFAPMPYMVTFLMGLFLLVYAFFDFHPHILITLSVVILFSGYQVIRIYESMTGFLYFKSWAKSVAASRIYAFVRDLAVVRGVVEKSRETDLEEEKRDLDLEDISSAEIRKVGSKSRTWRYEKEVVDTYRHMREHGNSAFIFVLVLILGGFCNLLIKELPTNDPQAVFTRLALLFTIWSFPAVCVHFQAQHVERRFSKHPRRESSPTPFV
jgi:hypothetical protein